MAAPFAVLYYLSPLPKRLIYRKFFARNILLHSKNGPIAGLNYWPTDGPNTKSQHSTSRDRRDIDRNIFYIRNLLRYLLDISFHVSPNRKASAPHFGIPWGKSFFKLDASLLKSFFDKLPLATLWAISSSRSCQRDETFGVKYKWKSWFLEGCAPWLAASNDWVCSVNFQI